MLAAGLIFCLSVLALSLAARLYRVLSSGSVMCFAYLGTFGS